MRKNRMMRAASALMVAVLLTTSTISGTFAKYVTQDSASDTARVAKWGVELQAVGNLYGDSYGSLEAGVNKIVANDYASVAVQSCNTDHTVDGDDVVAPGTKNDSVGFTFSLIGTPEVDGIVTSTLKVQDIFLATGTYGVMIKTDAVTAENYTEFFDDGRVLYYKDGTTYKPADPAVWVNQPYYTLQDKVELLADYYPVVYTLSGDTTATGTLKDIANKLAEADVLRIKGAAAKDGQNVWTYEFERKFDSNTDIAGAFKLSNEKLSWVWGFSVNDGADTILGMLENVSANAEVVMLSGVDYIAPTEYTHYCLDTQFDLLITVTQTAEDSGL